MYQSLFIYIGCSSSVHIPLSPNKVPNIPDQTEESTYAEMAWLAVYKSSSSGLPV